MSGHQREHSIDAGVTDTNARIDFYERAREQSLAPLWKVLAGLVTAEPRPQAVAHRWTYKSARPFLLEACDLITAEEAERRVLVLENPALPGQSRISESLYCGLQIIKPGERAPAHRHVSSALRFIIEGSNAYTAVDGERTMMLPGDFVVTPSWTWHDHANVGDAPMVWVDGLDMHVVNLLNASFREELSDVEHSRTRPDDSSTIEFGYAMAPENASKAQHATPIINYPYKRAKEALASLESHRKPDAHLGYIIKYLNPLNGDWALPTMATQMRLLPKGFSSASYRSTDSTVYVVVEGNGESRIGETEFTWERGDVFVAPSWHPQQHRAANRATLFSFSDRAIQEKLGIWRDSRIVTSEQT